MRRWNVARAAMACLLSMMAAAPVANAQDVALSGRIDPELGPRLEALFASGDFIIPADTILPRGDTIRGTLLLLGGTYYVEGHVAGDLVAVGANLFLRPRSSVAGDVVNAGGGLYPSALTRVDGEVLDRPLALYRVVREGAGWRVVGEAERESMLQLPHFAGFRIPTYDRVNGLSLRWGPELRLWKGARDTLALGVWGGYFSDRGDLGGGAELAFGARPLRARAGVERDWRTNEEWIRSDLLNSVVHLWAGKDYRDYYAVDRGYALVERGWTRGRTDFTAHVGAQVEDASSLSAGSPWSLLKPDSVRSNHRIDDGRTTSLLAGVGGEWIGLQSALEAALELEAAAEWLDGDHDFRRFRFFGEWGMVALANHVLEIEWMTMGPLPGTDSLPRQRRSFVGGSNTLNTFPVAKFRGDRVAFVESKYIIPLERMRIRVLGVPEIQLIHATGMAWTADESRDLEQEVGVRLQFAIAYARVMVNPEAGSPEFTVGVSSPFGRGRKWEQKR